MKVKIEDAQNADVFVPYTVTFFIQTTEESTRFHDRVACKITDGPHRFIGNIYERGHGDASGTEEFEI